MRFPDRIPATWIWKPSNRDTKPPWTPFANSARQSGNASSKKCRPWNGRSLSSPRRCSEAKRRGPSCFSTCWRCICLFSRRPITGHTMIPAAIVSCCKNSIPIYLLCTIIPEYLSIKHQYTEGSGLSTTFHFAYILLLYTIKFYKNTYYIFKFKSKSSCCGL